MMIQRTSTEPLNFGGDSWPCGGLRFLSALSERRFVLSECF